MTTAEFKHEIVTTVGRLELEGLTHLHLALGVDPNDNCPESDIDFASGVFRILKVTENIVLYSLSVDDRTDYQESHPYVLYNLLSTIAKRRMDEELMDIPGNSREEKLHFVVNNAVNAVWLLRRQASLSKFGNTPESVRDFLYSLLPPESQEYKRNFRNSLIDSMQNP